jgi:chromosome segregation ATPase
MTQQKSNSRQIEVDVVDKNIHDSIESVINMVSRIDERIKILYEKDDEYKNNLDLVSDDISSILQRLASMETTIHSDDIEAIRAKMHELDIRTSNLDLSLSNHSDKWSKTVDWIFKIVLTFISTYAAYKLGQN